MSTAPKLPSDARSPGALRPGRLDDLDTLYRLDQACYSREIAYSHAELREYLSHPRARTWVVEESQTLVGFIIVEQLRGSHGHIITLDVREDHRRCGFGGRLLASAEAWLRSQQVRRITLETATNNQAAIAFWIRSGYEPKDILPGYYLGRQDAYRCEKELA